MHQSPRVSEDSQRFELLATVVSPLSGASLQSGGQLRMQKEYTKRKRNSKRIKYYLLIQIC